MSMLQQTKEYPTFQTKVIDPYPHLNGGQQLGALEACLFLLLHVFGIQMVQWCSHDEWFWSESEQKVKFFEIYA